MEQKTIDLSDPSEGDMGKQRVVDKSIRPMTTTLTTLTPALVTSGRSYGDIGVLPVGYYKGAAAFWDLDLAVNQPNVVAEQQYILGILDGREEDYDLQTLTLPLLAVAGTALTGTLTVPTGELWYVNCIRLDCPGDATAGFTLNWFCSLWTDRIGAVAAGQPFRTAAMALASAGIATHTIAGGGAIQQLDEFGEIATAWAVTNKTPLLRLPAGAILTFTVLSDTAAPTVATACTLSVHGAMAKVLVQ